MKHANSIPHIIFTSLSITLFFFYGKKLSQHRRNRRKVKRSLASGQEQVSRKGDFLSDILAHEYNRDTFKNKVSLMNARNALNPLPELKVRENS